MPIQIVRLCMRERERSHDLRLQKPSDQHKASIKRKKSHHLMHDDFQCHLLGQAMPRIVPVVQQTMDDFQPITRRFSKL